jgi:hypothetical protein
MTKKKNPTPGEKLDDWIVIVSALIKGFGPHVVFILVLAAFIFWYADDAQKHEIIDKWILLKNENHVYCVLIIIVLVLSNVLFIGYHIRTMRFVDKKLKKF